MRTYIHPVTLETFKASTAEHAAARVFGGKPADYVTTLHEGKPLHVRGGATVRNRWLEVATADGARFLGDVALDDEAVDA